MQRNNSFIKMNLPDSHQNHPDSGLNKQSSVPEKKLLYYKSLNRFLFIDLALRVIVLSTSSKAG